jgi:2-polyprenyl-3-methyl-5-hydroxy-6-metoxy-1,4-benzoquinol methylase
MSLDIPSARPSVAPVANCLACSGSLADSTEGLYDTRFGIPGTYSVLRCSRCGLEQISPMPTAEELKRLYEKHYNFGGSGVNTYTRFRERLHASVLYRIWTALDGDISFHHRKGHGRLLDVGCNEGRGLNLYAHSGFQVEGLELNQKAALAARQRGFAVHACLLEDFHPAQAFDVVVLSNVLEHSLQPPQMLREVRRILKPGGQVFISCPNSQSWLRVVFGTSWINWHVPFHIVQFSPKTLADCMQEAGFSLAEIKQITPALWVASSVIVKLFAHRGRVTTELRSPALVALLLLLIRCLLFPFLFLGNLLGRGDCLLAVGRLPNLQLAGADQP